MSTATEESVVIGSVRVLPHFFASVLKDYADWLSALFCELLQNGKDCGSTKIDFTTNASDDGSFTVTCRNNGRPMSKDELFGKLLALGGTTKDAISTTGGFGRAKELLYFSQQSYVIRSGQWEVSGVGSEYSGRLLEQCFSGTESVIKLANVNTGYNCIGNHTITDRLKTMCMGSTLKGVVVTLNGVELEQMNSRRIKIDETDSYEAFKTKSIALSSWVVVRHGGLMLFKQYVGGLRRCVLLELKKPCTEVLLTSRCGFRSPWDKDFYDTMAKLVTDKLSSCNSDFERPLAWSNGRMFSVVKKSSDPVPEALVENLSEDAEPTGHVIWEEPIVPEVSPQCSYRLEKQANNAVPTPGELYNANQYCVFFSGVGAKLPPARYWKYGRTSNYISLLLTKWGKLIKLLYEATETSGMFAIGLNFSAKSEASHQSASGYDIYSINPLQGSKARFNAATLWKLPALAVHEFVHKEHRQHDETFASVLTDTSALLTRYSRQINAILRSKEKYEFRFPQTLTGK